MTITNAQPTATGGPDNGFLVPVTQWGKSFGFTFAYADPPTGADPSDFSLVLQSKTAGQLDVSMFDVQFSAAGGVTLMGAVPGVVITPQGGAPVPTPPSVPESSTTVSLGLMLLLGLGGIVVARRKKAH